MNTQGTPKRPRHKTLKVNGFSDPSAISSIAENNGVHGR